MPSPQGRFWMLTIPHAQWTPYLPPGVTWVRGQLELGDEGYLHWQIVICLTNKGRMATVRGIFGAVHCEPTRSAAADEYVWKDETHVEGTRFQLGTKPFRRSNANDWPAIWDAARIGDIDSIPASVRVQSYSAIRRIGADYAKPIAICRTCLVYWGVTGSGKSRKAWEEASLDAYPKSPRSKFWCGYQGQENVIIDEFRGAIDIAYLLTWLDRYPVIVEVKGSSLVLRATKIWITSNIHPSEWYPGLDPSTLDALLRRLTIVQFGLTISSGF